MVVDQKSSLFSGMVKPVHIRPVRPHELPELADVFAMSVKNVGPALYTPAQVAVWSSVPQNEVRFRRFIFGPVTFVADSPEGILGFSGISTGGRVVSLYVRHDQHRRGVGTQLLGHVIEHARTQGIYQLWTEASKFSKPLFEKCGFRLHRVEWVLRQGVAFDHHIMRMALLP